MQKLSPIILTVAAILVIIGSIYWGVMGKKVTYIDGKPYIDGMQKQFDPKKVGQVMTYTGLGLMAAVGGMYAYEHYGKKSASPMKSHLRYYYF